MSPSPGTRRCSSRHTAQRLRQTWTPSPTAFVAALEPHRVNRRPGSSATTAPCSSTPATARSRGPRSCRPRGLALVTHVVLTRSSRPHAAASTGSARRWDRPVVAHENLTGVEVTTRTRRRQPAGPGQPARRDRHPGSAHTTSTTSEAEASIGVRRRPARGGGPVFDEEDRARQLAHVPRRCILGATTEVLN